MLQQHILEAPWPRGRTISAAGSDNCSCLSCSRRRAGTRMDLDISSRHECCLVRTPQPFPPSGITTSDHVFQVRHSILGQEEPSKGCLQCKSAFCGRIILRLARLIRSGSRAIYVPSYLIISQHLRGIADSREVAVVLASRLIASTCFFNPQRPLVICFSWTVANAQGQPASPTD